MQIGEVLCTIDMEQTERVAGSFSVRDKQHDFLVGAVELEALEHHEVDNSEPLSKPAPDRLGVTNGQQLRR